MDRTKLLTRAEMNCLSFVNNLALSGATREQLGRGRVLSNFWSQISRNALDLAILDWCHAFGQHNDVLHWKKVFPGNEAEFRDDLLIWMDISFDEFLQFREHMKMYRDKDLAHMELRNISMIPAMSTAVHSMAFYFHQVQKSKHLLGMSCRDKNLYDISTWLMQGLIVTQNWPSQLPEPHVGRTYPSDDANGLLQARAHLVRLPDLAIPLSSLAMCRG
ncbi:hypothetical protein [Pseudomonas asiatica]|uniref:hypothetical protein n=1 Tax=Pseudomonas asiatica TaxID=2219225 RepID=UPI003877E74C